MQADSLTAAYEDEGVLVDSGQFTGMASAEAKEAIAAYLEEKGQGKPAVQLPPAGLAHLPAALLGGAHPHYLLRGLRRWCRCRRKTCPWSCPWMWHHRGGRLAPGAAADRSVR